MARRKVHHMTREELRLQGGDEALDRATAVSLHARLTTAVADRGAAWTEEAMRRAFVTMANDAARMSWNAEVPPEATCPPRSLREAARLLRGASFEDDQDQDQAPYTADELVATARWFDGMGITKIKPA